MSLIVAIYGPKAIIVIGPVKMSNYSGLFRALTYKKLLINGDSRDNGTFHYWLSTVLPHGRLTWHAIPRVCTVRLRVRVSRCDG